MLVKQLRQMLRRRLLDHERKQWEEEFSLPFCRWNRSHLEHVLEVLSVSDRSGEPLAQLVRYGIELDRIYSSFVPLS